MASSDIGTDRNTHVSKKSVSDSLTRVHLLRIPKRVCILKRVCSSSNELNLNAF